MRDAFAYGEEEGARVEESEDARRILSARPATKGERVLYWTTVGRQD
jgi:hypothetical protein